MRKMACLLMLVAGCGSQIGAQDTSSSAGRGDTIVIVPIVFLAENPDVRLSCRTFSELDILDLAIVMDDAWWANGSFQEQLDVNLAACSDDFVPLICLTCLDRIAEFVHFTVH